MPRIPAFKIVQPVTPLDEGSPMSSREQTPETLPPEQCRRFRPSRATLRMERLALAVLVVAFAVNGFIPAWIHLKSDFPNYYLVAGLYRSGYPLDRVYDWIWLQREKDRQGIEEARAGFVPVTIPSALPLAAWSSLPPLTAKHRWLVLNVVLLLFTGFLLYRMTKLRWEQIALVVLLAFVPLRDNFLFGQMHVAVLFLLTLAAWLYCRKFGFLAGITLAMGAALKIYPALFLIYFAFKRQWRAAAGVVVGLCGAVVASLWLFGTEACRVYAVHVLPSALRGETIDPYHPMWNSWTALLRRLFIAEPELNPAPVAHLPWLYALLHPLIHSFILILFLWVIGREQRDTERTKIEWGAFVFLLLFLSSQPASYHFVALILTAGLVFDYMLARENWRGIAFAAAIYVLICGPALRVPWFTPTAWQNLLFFPRLAFMTVFAGLLLLMLLPTRSQEWAARFGRWNALVAASALIVIVAVSFFMNERHFRGQFENYQSRIGTTPDSLLAQDPAPSGLGIFYTRMTSVGYGIARANGEAIEELAPVGADLFHPIVSDKANALWVEECAQKNCRIVQVALGANGQEGSMTTEAEDAQEPVVSRDGEWLAFLRPVKGRNSLWIRELGNGPKASGEQQLAGLDYDVREASFLSDNSVIFSSRRSGRFALYVATQQGVKELPSPSCSAHYPAMSPDGRWLAFGCEEIRGAQIHVMEWGGKHELELTSSECNSTGPAWTPDSKRLIYATDCGRGVGLTALAELTVVH